MADPDGGFGGAASFAVTPEDYKGIEDSDDEENEESQDTFDVDATGGGKNQRDPTGIWQPPASVNKINFRQLSSLKSAGSTADYVSVSSRDVTFTEDYQHEIPATSKISLAGFDSTLPMAFDNRRFFASEDGYKELLTQASKAMADLAQQQDSWKEPDKEMGLCGWIWRCIVKFFMSLTTNAINRLNFTRGIQESLPFQTGYESFAIGGVIRAFDIDDRGHDKFNLNLAFKNRNTSRVLVQQLSDRWDWLWHLYTQITWSRLFDFIGQFPFIGITAFPATENFPSSKDHALRGTFRLIFEGSWITRFFTGKTEGIVTFDRTTAAQNLAAESTGFEDANRNQYGTTFGREKTNEFRFEHRLPTDESIVRTFMTSPSATMVNNGVEHVLRCLAKHWRNMLYQDNGNFAHQRMEQLNPFEVLRFHMPIVLHVLANLRGRNVWDTKVLGPFTMRLQHLNPDKIRRRTDKGDVETAGDDSAEIEGPCLAAKKLCADLKKDILPNVCAGIPSRMDPLQRWLDAIEDALSELSREAEVVREFVSSVDPGIKLGYSLLKLVNWHVPTEAHMKSAIIDYILDKPDNHPDLPRTVINTAIQKLASIDERSLKELVKQGYGNIEAAKLLLGRTCSLLERELRRMALDERLHELAKGPAKPIHELERNKWYWVETGGSNQGPRVSIFKGQYGNRVRFVDVEYQLDEMKDIGGGLKVRQYIPVAEAISRAQKAFMTIELDHGKRFSYNAFMEFGSTERNSSMRTRLRRLITIAQVHCPELDKARLNVLSEIKSSVHRVKQSPAWAESRLVAECKPQNVTVLGGGPTGLLCAIHCLQNVILSGGDVKVYEARDAFDKEALAFERAQIVRLDSRQISMLRYHLGTGYEDVYIPCKGETDPHLGNTLPTQGFVEVTIKRLESMILDEMINLQSKSLLYFYAGGKINYDIETGKFEKQGSALKAEDLFFNDDGQLTKVEDFIYRTRVSKGQLVEGKDYDIKLPREKNTRVFRLVQMDDEFDFYQFSPHEPGIRSVAGSFSELPPIYLSGQGRVDPTDIVVSAGGSKSKMPYDSVSKKYFTLDFSKTHVIVASGKPAKTKTHLYTTTEEPYAVCCIEGIKIAMGMHNLGEKRWGSGFIDDIRSHSDQNTRVIGDFTKSVRLIPIVKRMRYKLTNPKEAAWQSHFNKLPDSVQDKVAPVHAHLVGKIASLCETPFRRERLQTRFFELGNNYYLGMEFPREFDDWKNKTVEGIAPPLRETETDAAKRARGKFRGALLHHLDRLWYEACLEVIAEGDVYNPGGRGKIPQLYTIDSPFQQKLRELKELEAFRLFKEKYRVVVHDGNGFTKIQAENSKDSFDVPTTTYAHDIAAGTKRALGELASGDLFEPVDLFEVVAKKGNMSIVRNSRGYIALMSNDVPVGRVSDLARAPDGYSESKVALAAFPVAHVVSFRTLYVNRVQGKGGEDAYMTAFVGDAQSSPHFMRYSGLTGACINCMSVNNLVGQAIQGTGFEERIQRYSFETNWSNGEVVQRGTGANYGEDGFLRPGFPYRKLVDYLYARAQEHYEIGADTNGLLSRDWKIKLAAAIVPRGLENDDLFYEALLKQLAIVVRGKFVDEVKRETGADALPAELDSAISTEMADYVNQWTGAPPKSSSPPKAIKKVGLFIKSIMIALKQTVDYSVELRQGNLRVSSELFNQPKPVDSVVDDFAVEAQNFANALTQSAAFAAATVALQLQDGDGASIASWVLGIWNIGVSFGTMTNTARYRNRNEEARAYFFDHKLRGVMKSVFSLMTKAQRDRATYEENPFFNHLEKLCSKFVTDARYYNSPEKDIALFVQSYEGFKGSKKDQTSTIKFMRELVQVFVPETFQENSYLQQDLVDIYKELDEMLSLSKQAPTSGMSGADELFSMLFNFRKQLEASLERGEVKYGFLKDHKWHQTPLPVTLKFIFGPLFCSRTISGKTLEILKKAKKLQTPGTNEKTLRRPIRDLTELYHATNESQIGSMMFLSGFIVFCFSVFFTVFRIIEAASDADFAEDVVDGASWAALGSMLGAAIAVFHFLRKLKILFGLDKALGVMRSDPSVRRAILVTRTQDLNVFVRLIAVLAASVALPWSIIANTWDFDGDIPAYIAVVSVCAAIGAAIFFFFVEFLVRYNLDPCLGQAVCEPFRAHIQHIKNSFTTTDSETIETPQNLEREAWEYTAREFLHEYRFDAVFAADRFGSILQHIQSGNKEKDE